LLGAIPVFKQRYAHEKITFKVSVFFGKGGEVVPDFKDCTVVMVTPLDPMKGGSLPYPRDMFKVGTKIGDVFTEVIERIEHQEEE
jgi:hypothetical protein